MTAPTKVLIIEDEVAFWSHYQRKLSPLGLTFETAASPMEAAEKLTIFVPDIVLLDLSFEVPKGHNSMQETEQATKAEHASIVNVPSSPIHDTTLVWENGASASEGLTFLSYIRRQCPGSKVIVVTGNSEVENALEAVRRGAADFIEKGSGFLDALLFRVQAINERLQLEKQLRHQQDYAIDRIGGYPYGTGQIIVGTSEAMHRVFHQIDRLAKIEETILVSGATGTGKELVAQAIHYHSHRSTQPFLPLNCAAFPEDLIEDELFGHKRGAFSGATSDRLGAFEAADGGTIFLDEIGEMPLTMQPRLLRVLQEKQVKRIGENQERPINVRIVAATNRDLKQSVSGGNFRQDLYYRLSSLPIELPPLREREGDIRLLVQHFTNIFCQQYQIDRYFTAEAMSYLTSQVWDGNVRELRDSIQRSILFSNSEPISIGDIEPESSMVGKRRNIDNTTSGSGKSSSQIKGDLSELNDLLQIKSYAEARRAFEDWYVRKVYESTDGNQSQTARLLDIDRNTVRRILSR